MPTTVMEAIGTVHVEFPVAAILLLMAPGFIVFSITFTSQLEGGLKTCRYPQAQS